MTKVSSGFWEREEQLGFWLSVIAGVHATPCSGALSLIYGWA